MAANARLKNEFTEDEKYHNLMSWLISGHGKGDIGWHRRRDSQSYSDEPPHDKTNEMACAPNEDSDQPGHPPSLIRVFDVRSIDR